MKFIDLISCVGGRMVRGANVEIGRVIDDSRAVRAGDLFVARTGTKTSGQSYIADALAKGAVAVVTESGQESAAGEAPALATVGDVNLALALMAHEAAGNPTKNMTMIAVTGTKGKTTIAYLLRSVLRVAGHKVGMIGTVEIDDGEEVVAAEMTTPGAWALVELFARMRENGVTHCVMEVSSHALHQRRVAGIGFKVGIFTNLTGDHLDYHKTMEEYAAAKALLFEGLGKDAVAVINADDKWAERMVAGCVAAIVRYGIGIGDHWRKISERPVEELTREWRAAIGRMSSSGMDLEVFEPGAQWTVTTPLVGRHNVYNLLSVIAAASSLGIAVEEILDSVVDLRGAPGRLEAVKHAGAESLSVFVDYAHTHDALENVLTALRGTMGAGRLICMFGCGGDRDRTKRPKMAAIAERLADVVVLTSDNPRTEKPGDIIDEVCTGFSANWKETGKITVEADRRAAINLAIGLAQAGDVVLLAGKGHETYQIIGTTKHHFDDVEEAQKALSAKVGA